MLHIRNNEVPIDEGIDKGTENPHTEVISAVTGRFNRDIGMSEIPLIENRTRLKDGSKWKRDNISRDLCFFYC